MLHKPKVIFEETNGTLRFTLCMFKRALKFSTTHFTLHFKWVIDQVWGQDGWILAKFFFCVFMNQDGFEVHKHAKKERNQYQAILTKQAWLIKDLLYDYRGRFSCGTRRVVPSGQDNSILPARVANHSAWLIHLARSRNWPYNKISYSSCGEWDWTFYLPCLHGEDSQSSISIVQLGPLYPGSQVHLYPPV